MIKISYQALTKLMVNKGHRFVTEPVPAFEDGSVVKWVTASYYPSAPFVSYGIGDVRNKVSEDRILTLPQKPILYYDFSTSKILATCIDIYEYIKNIQQEAIRKVIDEINDKQLVNEGNEVCCGA